MNVLKIGIIGTGAIATQFAKEAKQNKQVDLVAVVARDFEKTQVFAQKFEIIKAFPTVETFLADETIEAVYVATLHTTHALYSKQALLAGKHVLCEKPAAIKPWQLEELFTIAKRQNKLFMEAITVGFHPLYQEIKAKIAAGVIGEVTHVEATLGKISQKEHKHTPELAGGCVYDIGIYNLFLILDLLGKPRKIQAQVRKHRKWNVPGTVQMLAEHLDGAQSYNFMTMDAISTSMATIMGTEGTIVIPKSWTLPIGYEIHTSNGEYFEKVEKQQSWLGYELEEFRRLVEAGVLESNIMTHQKSLNLQEMIEALYEEIGVIIPADAILM